MFRRLIDANRVCSKMARRRYRRRNHRSLDLRDPQQMSLFPSAHFGEGDFGESRQIMMHEEQFIHDLNDSGCSYCPFSRVPFDASFNDVPLYAVDTFYVLVDDQRRKYALPQIKADGEV